MPVEKGCSQHIHACLEQDGDLLRGSLLTPCWAQRVLGLQEGPYLLGQGSASNPNTVAWEGSPTLHQAWLDCGSHQVQWSSWGLAVGSDGALGSQVEPTESQGAADPVGKGRGCPQLPPRKSHTLQGKPEPTASSSPQQGSGQGRRVLQKSSGLAVT